MARRQFSIFNLQFSIYLAAALACWPALGRASLSDAIDATCRIRATNGDTGSGCVFERSQGQVWVLTCAHVATTPTVQCEFWQAGHQSTPIVGRVAMRNEQADAAVVAIPEASFGGRLPAIIPLAGRDVSFGVGQTLTSVGCANGAWSTGWKGHVLRADGGELRFVPTPANGRSGAAVFDAEATVIVGLLRARNLEGTEGIATSAAGIRTAFESPAVIDRPPYLLPYRRFQAQQGCPGTCPPGTYPGQTPRQPIRPIQPIQPPGPAPKPRLDLAPVWPSLPPGLPDTPAPIVTVPIVPAPPQVAPESGLLSILRGRVETVESKQGEHAGLLARLQERLEAVKQTAALAGDGKIREVAQDVALTVLAEKAPSVVSLMLPGFLAALGITLPGGAVAVAAWLAGRGAKRLATKLAADLAARRTSTIPAAVQQTIEAAQASPANPAPSTTRPLTSAGAEPAAGAAEARNITVVNQARPDTRYVQVEVPTAREKGYDAAMDEFAARHKNDPKAVTWLESLQAYARQFESGIKPQTR